MATNDAKQSEGAKENQYEFLYHLGAAALQGGY
jgi:hypothetical protein